MYEYDEECLKTFLKNQAQLFDEPVAETLEEGSGRGEHRRSEGVSRRGRSGCRQHVS